MNEIKLSGDKGVVSLDVSTVRFIQEMVQVSGMTESEVFDKIMKQAVERWNANCDVIVELVKNREGCLDKAEEPDPEPTATPLKQPIIPPVSPFPDIDRIMKDLGKTYTGPNQRDFRFPPTQIFGGIGSLFTEEERKAITKGWDLLSSSAAKLYMQATTEKKDKKPNDSSDS